MSGIDLRDETLVVEREPNRLDELAIRWSQILDRIGVRHVFVAGYVSILAGRARSTEDIDVLVEEIDEPTAESLVATLHDEGFWGPAMPLDSLHEMLSNGDNIWVAPDEQVTPHLEIKFARDEFDRASLENAITARIDGNSLPIGPLELQIAYKLYLGTRTDIEDAVYLDALFGDNLDTARLEEWVARLGVEGEYDRLERA